MPSARSPPQARYAHDATCGPCRLSLSPAPKGKRCGLVCHLAPPTHACPPPPPAAGERPCAPPRTGASQNPRGIERGKLRSPLSALPGDPVWSWGPLKAGERGGLSRWDDARCRGRSQSRDGERRAGESPVETEGAQEAPGLSLAGAVAQPSQGRESTPADFDGCMHPERERGKGYQLPFKQQKNPTDKESQTRSGAPSALPLSPVETAASQSQSLMTARGFLSPQHAVLVAITQKKSAKTCAPPCSPSPARSQ